MGVLSALKGNRVFSKSQVMNVQGREVAGGRPQLPLLPFDRIRSLPICGT